MLGTYYLFTYQDANRHNRIRLIEYNANVECKEDWLSAAEVLKELAPHAEAGRPLVCMGTNQTSELVSHGLVKCDGDKGVKGAFKEAGLARWGCTNHGVANVAKHSGRRGQGEVYRCCARAGNKSKWSYFYNKLTDNIKAYLERSRRVNIEEWSC